MKSLAQIYSGKTVVIAGAGGRMGKALATILVKLGIKVVAVDVYEKVTGHTSRNSPISLGHWIELDKLDKFFSDGNADLLIDFTKAGVAPQIVKTCIKHKVPFVSGTTGWDYNLAKNEVVSGVVDQNMHPVLVALFDAIDYMVKKYSGIFRGYNARCDEEHQEEKEGPSGTAAKWMPRFIFGGATNGGIKATRKGEKAHAFHLYELLKGSIGKSATQIMIATRIWSMDEYAYGAVLAGAFLLDLVEDEAEIYDMRDVLTSETVSSLVDE